jgi:hypothetical protein
LSFCSARPRPSVKCGHSSRVTGRRHRSRRSMQSCVTGMRCSGPCRYGRRTAPWTSC